MKTIINLIKMCLIFKINIRILKLPINTKLKWKSQVENYKIKWLIKY